MQVEFGHEHSRELFEGGAGAPVDVSAAVVRAFRFVVSFLAAAKHWGDIEAMRSFRTHRSSTDEDGWFSIALVDPWAVRVQVQGQPPWTEVLVGDLAVAEEAADHD